MYIFIHMPNACITYKDAFTAQFHLTLCNPGTAARQAPLSTGFSRQEYWSQSPFPSPRDLPDPGIKPRSPALQVDSLPFEPPGKYKGICIQYKI